MRDEDRLEAAAVAAAGIAATLMNPGCILWSLTVPLLSIFEGTIFSRSVRRNLAKAWTPPARRDEATAWSDESDSDSDSELFANGDARRKRVRRKRLATRDVEDCWLPFFCVTTNVTKQICQQFDSGDVVFACRASMRVRRGGLSAAPSRENMPVLGAPARGRL